MFGIGETELALILIFAFLIFGPDKLPGMGRTIGRMLRQFREAQEGFTEVVQTEVMDPLNNAMNEPQTEDERKRSSARVAAMDEDADIESAASSSANGASSTTGTTSGTSGQGLSGALGGIGLSGSGN